MNPKISEERKKWDKFLKTYEPGFNFKWETIPEIKTMLGQIYRLEARIRSIQMKNLRDSEKEKK